MPKRTGPADRAPRTEVAASRAEVSSSFSFVWPPILVARRLGPGPGSWVLGTITSHRATSVFGFAVSSKLKTVERNEDATGGWWERSRSPLLCQRPPLSSALRWVKTEDPRDKFQVPYAPTPPETGLNLNTGHFHEIRAQEASREHRQTAQTGGDGRVGVVESKRVQRVQRPAKSRGALLLQRHGSRTTIYRCTRRAVAVCQRSSSSGPSDAGRRHVERTPQSSEGYDDEFGARGCPRGGGPL